MSDQPLTYSLAVGPFELLIREISGYEELSKPWKLEVKLGLDPQTMVGIPEDFHPDAVIKQETRIILKRDDELQRVTTGVITECNLSCTRSGIPQVEMTVEPRYALLKWRQDVRLHRNLNAWQIVEEVANALGVKTEVRLRDSYPVRPYCVQWRETDFDYCNRLLEDEGIFYFFTSDDTMVLGDHPGAYSDIAGDTLIPFRAGHGMILNEDAITRVGSKAILTPGKGHAARLEHRASRASTWTSTTTRRCRSASSGTTTRASTRSPSEGARKAQASRRGLRHPQRARHRLAPPVRRLYPGCVFQLTETPIGSLPRAAR